MSRAWTAPAMTLSDNHAVFTPPPAPPSPSEPLRLIRVADHVHPSMPPPMRGGEVSRVSSRRPLPPPRCVQREHVSTPSGSAPSAAPTRVHATAFRTGSIAELHPQLLARLEEADASVEVTFPEELSEDPTQRMDRRSSLPPPSAPERESAVVAQRPRAETLPAPRESLPTIQRERAPSASEDTTSGVEDLGDRHARIPEPPAREERTPVARTPVVPALRVAVYTARDGTPQLALHLEGEPVGAPTAVLVPDSRDDALRILQIFERAGAG